MNEKPSATLDDYTIFRLLDTLSEDGTLSQRDLARGLDKCLPQDRLGKGMDQGKGSGWKP